MARRSHAYDAQKAEQLLTFLQAGAYGHIAAEAAEISAATLHEWLRRGQGKGATEPYRSFARRYVQTRALARLHAELEVFKKDPKLWLKCGPGKETADSPGWSREVSPSRAQPSASTGSGLDHPLLADLSAAVLEALKPFPEARLAVAAALQSLADDAQPKTKQLSGTDASAGSEEGHES
ncbi:MAG: hypothetical protein L0Z62_38370 [Gemmataceae bacterium]|nr:hypothetical protein [Gemmataceae bacterium]